MQWDNRNFINSFTTQHDSNRAGGLRELDGTARWESYTDMAIAYAFAESFEVLHVANQRDHLALYPVGITIIRPAPPAAPVPVPRTAPLPAYT
jgi:hypothetical protein